MINNDRNIYELNEDTNINRINICKNYDIKNNRFIRRNQFVDIFIYLSKILSFVILFYLIFIYTFIKKTVSRYDKLIIDIYNKNSNINNFENNSKNILERYKKEQNDFCENPNKYINKQYEKEIFLVDVKLNDLNYKMYMPKPFNWVQEGITKTGSYEKSLSNYMIEALKFYSMNYKITHSEDIVILDIGGNVGWYPSLLGRYGYTILSFEAFEKNYYISKKNYCYLNKNSNVIIITKGLGTENKTCNYFSQKNNEGNGMVICEKKDNLFNKLLSEQFVKVGEVEITTLNSFIPYISDKKIVLMKLDVEGHELKVLEGGKDLISKYHVPFIVLEFTPIYFKEQGSDPKELIKLFVDNGYKISLDGFLNKNYITINELLNKTEFQFDCYFIHESLA